MSLLQKKYLQILPIVILVVFVTTFSFLISTYSTDEILNFIGVDNAYLLMFLLAIVGGMSTFTGVPYHLVLITLGSSGLNPVLLGLATAAGVMIGDSTSYLIGKQSNQVLPEKLKKKLYKFANFLSQKPKLIAPFLFLYGTFSPFSNDFIVISMGFISYPYKKIIVPLSMGNILYNIGLASLGYYAIDSIHTLFF